MSTPHVVLTDVTRIHGDRNMAVVALAGVSLEVPAGRRVAIVGLVAVMGPSGSGKSTLLNVAGGLDRPTSGTVTIAGDRLTDLAPRDLAKLRRRRMGFIFQDYNLIPSLTAAENVALPLELDGTRAGQARRQARRTLDLMNLMELSDRFPDQMSGGQQQRVAIARALVGSRRFVLADEPTGALDSHTGEEVLRVLRERWPACSSPTRRGTPPGPIGSCSCGTGSSSTAPAIARPRRTCSSRARQRDDHAGPPGGRSEQRRGRAPRCASPRRRGTCRDQPVRRLAGKLGGCPAYGPARRAPPQGP